MNITVKYSCEGCGLVNVDCQVPARMDEPVLVWMDQTIRALSADHGRRSPGCPPKSLQEIMIPMTGADRVGGPPLQ